MRKEIRPLLAAILIAILVIPVNAMAKSKYPTTPKLNHGQKWRIGYCEGGPYINYTANLRTLVAGLAELGWIAPITIPAQEDDRNSKLIWDYLVRNTKSDYLEFVADGHWSAGWSKEERQILKDKILKRLNTRKDIDFMIAMGTWAGQDLYNDNHSTPTMAVSVSDPVRAGMSATAEDSGLDHFHAKCDPTRYIRQLRLFHRVAQFKRLGVVYENSPEGRTYAAFEDIKKVAKERNFSIVTCEAPIAQVDPSVSIEKMIQCHEELAPKVDAVFVTVHPGVHKDHMKELVAPFLKYKIPTWSQRGPMEVKKGILFSISRGGFKAVGKFHAEVMAQVFNGAQPRQISQIFEDPKLVAINQQTAKTIGFRIPHSIKRIADEVYETIEE